MFHRAKKLTFREGTVLEVSFENGETKQYDVARLFSDFPEMKALLDRNFFLQGILETPYGIAWDDYRDLAVEEVYVNGTDVV